MIAILRDRKGFTFSKQINRREPVIHMMDFKPADSYFCPDDLKSAENLTSVLHFYYEKQLESDVYLYVER